MQIDSTTRVLVTGANGGLGAAIARAFHREGARLVLSGRRADALAPLAAELGAEVVVADLAAEGGVAALVGGAGEVDVAVLNAALPASGTLDRFDAAGIERLVRVNLTAPMATAQAIVPGMVARGRGHLVFISSVAGLVASPGSALYNATKFGLRGFALGLRSELGAQGVGVSTIYPGFIRDAGMFAVAGAKLPMGVGTRSPDDVGRSTVTAVRRDRGEVVVAALDQRVAAFVSTVSPTLAELGARMPFARKLAAEVTEGQRRAMGSRFG